MSKDRQSAVPALPDGAPAPDDLRQALDTLEAVASDRSLLARLSDDERRQFLIAAGRTVHPEVEQKRRLVKALRAAKRRRVEAHDRAAAAGTGIRRARESL